VGLDALALAAALHQLFCDVVLSGAVTRQQLESNLRALDLPWGPDCAAWVGPLAQPPAAYWAERSERPWS